jgi:serine/threonine protein kinase
MCCLTSGTLTGGLRADERADLYSLGVTIYEMCQGHPPSTGSQAEIPVGHDTVPYPPLDRDDLPEALKELIRGLLAREPGQRPASATEVVQRLDAIRAAVNGPPTAPDPLEDESLPRPAPAELKAPARAKAADYTVGEVIDGRFEVLSALGQGGFSKVYHVRDQVEDEERALKLFNTARGYEAVRREIGALRKIRNPHVVEVYWAGSTSAGEWYLITEFIDGEPLSEFTSGIRVLRDREAVDVALDLLDAFVAFHPDSERLRELDEKNREGGLSGPEYDELMDLKRNGLVHRDVKPLNVMLTRKGAKLLDFNIASRVGDEVNTLSGTPPYQPPGADYTRWDVSPDLFAVGVVLYQLLCDGAHPYPDAHPMLDEPVIDPRTIRSDLNPGLAEFLVKACAPAHADRFTTAAEMQLSLSEIRTAL